MIVLTVIALLSWPCPAAVTAEWDSRTIFVCMKGPARPRGCCEFCAPLDYDGDGDADLADFAEHQRCLK